MWSADAPSPYVTRSPGRASLSSTGRSGVLLLVGVARHEPPRGPEAHVDEAGAVDAGRGHPAPEIRRAEERARVRDRVGEPALEPLGVGLAADGAPP